MPDNVLAAISEEARLRGLPLQVHAQMADDAMRAVELGAKRFMHPPTGGDPDMTRLAQTLSKGSVPFSTTIHGGAPMVDATGALVDHQSRPYTPEAEARLYSNLAGIRRLFDSGVAVAFGTDRFTNSPAEDVTHEIDALNRIFSRAEVITLLTRNAAAFVGLSNEIGTLEPGKRADILIIDGNPLVKVSELSKVKVVVQRGRIVLDKR